MREQDDMPLKDQGAPDPPTVLVEVEPPPDELPDPDRNQYLAATRQSTQATTPRRRLIETAYAVLNDTDDVKDYEIQSLVADPIAFATSKSAPDTLHYQGAMDAHDAKEFQQAMLKEVDAHTNNEHWQICVHCDVPAGHDILPAVWAFKRKRRINTRAVYKYKARLNIHGGMQNYGVNYWETYSPVVNWFLICLSLILALLFSWHARQIDFVLAFPQANVECDLYMHLP
jgi:hypothetical protein